MIGIAEIEGGSDCAFGHQTRLARWRAATFPSLCRAVDVVRDEALNVF
jgi:hypothetical protein